MKKNLLVFCALVLNFSALFAQNEATQSAFTTGEIRAGYGITRFGSGLKEAYEAGEFGATGGGLFSLAAYRKFAKIPFVQLGMKFKALGAGPSMGENGNEMFFNYWCNGLSAKFYPFDRTTRKGLVIYGDYFFVSQFTQKYRNTAQKVFNHQFAIGSAFNGGLAYEIPLGEKRPVLTLGLEYESARRQGEVTGIGDKIFQNTNLGFLVGLRF